jgi:hypothetical protein
MDEPELATAKKRGAWCPLCPKDFICSTVARYHILIAHAGIKVFQCMFCLDSFSSMGNLKRHHNKKHEGLFLFVDLRGAGQLGRDGS